MRGWYCPECPACGQFGGSLQLLLHMRVSHSGAPYIEEVS